MPYALLDYALNSFNMIYTLIYRFSFKLNNGLVGHGEKKIPIHLIISLTLLTSDKNPFIAVC